MSPSESEDTLVQELEVLLATAPAQKDGTKNLDAALDRILAAFDCVLGTIHLLDPETGLLRLAAERGLPPVVAEKVQTVPVGKGMAGIAAERMEPVQVCNLQTDDSGVARPKASETLMEGCISAPIIVDGELRGAFGVAKPHAYEFTAAETALLLRVGSTLGRAVS